MFEVLLKGARGFVVGVSAQRSVLEGAPLTFCCRMTLGRPGPHAQGPTRCTQEAPDDDCIQALRGGGSGDAWSPPGAALQTRLREGWGCDQVLAAQAGSRCSWNW